MSSSEGNKLRDRSIADYGDQWTTYTRNEGWYGSTDIFRDILGPLVSEDDIRGKNVADIGSGTGRIVNMLLSMGAAHVTAIEPSAAFGVLRRNVAHHGDKVTCLQLRGDQIPPDDFDHVFSIGVLIIIPDPKPVVDAAYRALKPGGRFTVWLYGREGVELYLAIFEPVMKITRKLPHAVLSAVCWMLTVPLSAYIGLSRLVPLPMHEYVTKHLGPMTWDVRHLTIYDQLNPSYVKYYTRQEAHDLIADGGFENVQIYHRHGYSYTVTATKPVK
jgi:SAM-dependent methyltransferase